MRKADAAWRAYASSHAMQYQPPRGWLHPEWPRAEGSLEGVAVAIEVAIHVTHLDYSTACVAGMNGPAKGDLEVSREGFSSKVARLWGAQDLVVGDDPFDRAFVVKATPTALAAELLAADVRAEMLALRADRLTYGNGEHGQRGLVVVEFMGVVEDAGVLDRGLRLVAGLARRA